VSPRTVLPIDSHLAEIAALVSTRRAAVITAAPGAGKTTRVPPALAGAGPVLVLQPRRVAARAMAARVAEENGWTLGREVGWHVRFDRRASGDTRILFATEGILTARLVSDPLLGDFTTIIVDEFHERSIYADLGLALARQAWHARDDLRLVVMSATIDAERIAAYLDGAPVVRVPGRTFPVAVSYEPGRSVEDAVVAAMPAAGAALCFLPGAGEIARAQLALQPRLAGVDVLPLHGGLDADAQDAALRPSSVRRVILATNLAETTVTVPDVSVVIDSGVHKVARYDAERGVDRLVTERIPNDSAEQRAGRAGRVQAGRAERLWDPRDRLREHREAEIHRIDLAATLLDVLAWGGDPWTPGAFDWYEAPPAAATAAARELLFALEAIDAAGRLTPLGRELRAFAVHPRLARLIIADGMSMRAARAAAWLGEGGRAPDVDITAIVESPAFPRHLDQLARSFVKSSAKAPSDSSAGGSAKADDRSFRRALFAAYPDRLARRREIGSDRFALASGTGARLAKSSGALNSEFLVALEIRHVETGKIFAKADEPLITIASPVDADWIRPTSREIVHTFDPAARKVRAARIERYGALVLSSHAVAADPAAAAPIAFAAWRARERAPEEVQILARLRFAAASAGGFGETLAALAGGALPHWIHTIDEAGNPLGALPADVRRALDRAAPATLRVPSGRERPLEYRDDGSVMASVKLQELFGLAETPLVGPGKVPVTFELLAPNGRPVQVTRDLRSFWTRGYPEVRKELRGRYPRHPWPDDPWTAAPTARTKRR
jgi:ATP-dependent helicase HrpB